VPRRPTYQDLKKRVRELEQKSAKCPVPERGVPSHHDFLEPLLDAIPYPVFVKDKNGIYVGCNALFAQEVLGLPKAEVVGHSHVDLCRVASFGLTQSDHDKDMKLISEPGASGHEAKIQCADGVEHDFLFNKATFADANGQVLGIVGVMTDITDLKLRKKDLRTCQAHLRFLSSELLMAEEHERRQIAMDLHDRIGQNLAVTKMKLDELRNTVPRSTNDDALGEIRDLIDQTIKDARSLSFDLNPPAVHENDLGAAIEWLAENFQQQHGILTELVDDRNLMPLEEVIHVFIFRAIQELLFNIAKHANAHRARIVIQGDEDGLLIQVEDDGIGFDHRSLKYRSGVTAGFGLSNIRDRVKGIGGRLEVESELYKGTRIPLSVPIIKMPP